MQHFDNILSSCLNENKQNLIKVKFKADPAKVNEHDDVMDVQEYTGYVLQEFEDGSGDVFVPDAGLDNPIIRMMIGDQQPNTRYEYLLDLIGKMLSNKGVGDKLEELQSLDCIHKIEDFMKMNNFADSEIIEIFKEYISETTPG
jgi:hypothetical protein